MADYSPPVPPLEEIGGKRADLEVGDHLPAESRRVRRFGGGHPDLEGVEEPVAVQGGGIGPAPEKAGILDGHPDSILGRIAREEAAGTVEVTG